MYSKNTENRFYNLTPDIILKAAETAGFRTNGLLWQLNSFENRVYDIECEDRSHIIIKFYRPERWTLEQILEEHEFIFDLKKNDITVCSPLILNNNSSVLSISDIYYSIWKRTGGRAPDEFTPSDRRELGRLIGQIHSIGKLKKMKQRKIFNTDTIGDNSISAILTSGLLPESFEDRYLDITGKICNIYEELSEGVELHRIHGDCHPGNILYNRGFFFLDFDDSLTGPAIQDLWMLGLEQNNRKGFYDIIEGYNVFSDFNDSWLKLIEPLRGLRYIYYSAWIAKRWDDPAFKKAFDFFGTSDYWTGELQDLETQLKIIETGSPEKSHHYIEEIPTINEENKLTNKDFFWDWEE